MAIWSVTGNQVTLTLEAGDSGIIQRAHTFTAADGVVASELHTFYLLVNPSSLAVKAFLEVVGGETTLATITSAQTLRAEGTSNASAQITVRFGVQEAETGGAGGGSSTETFDFPNLAAAQAAGWDAEGNVNFNRPFAVNGVTPSIELTSGGVKPAFFKTFNRPVGSTWRVRAWGRVEEPTSWFVSCAIRLTNEDGDIRATPSLSGNDVEEEMVTPGSVAATGNGNLLVRISTNGWESYDHSFNFAQLTLEAIVSAAGATVVFDNLTFCVGSGIGTGGPGTDDGSPPPEPPPGGWPAPPTGGARPFGAWGLPAGGLGFWNMTVKRATPRAIINLLREAEEGDAYLLFTMGPESEQVAGGQFSFELWKAQMDALYNDTRIRTALEAAIAGTAPYTKRRAWGHMVFDEPFQPTRRGGGIPYGTVERCVVYSKTLFSNWLTILRVDPTDDRYVRKMAGLDCMWGEYSLARGPIDSYISTRLSAVDAWGHLMIFGIHYKEFEGPSGPSPRYITPTELRYYGGKFAARSETIAMGGWKYENGLWVQVGFPDALQDVRDQYASNDPP
jgi:hypothetical protein